MALQDIINDSWNGNPKKDVREGIQAALREIKSSLAGKADLVGFGAAKKVSYSQMPLMALANVTPINTLSPSADVVSANKLWYYSDGNEHKLYYRGNDETDTLIGSPAYILYYSRDNASKQYNVYRWAGNGFEAISEIDDTLIAGKADLDGKTGRLPYSSLPGMVFVSMGPDLDGKEVNLLNVRDRSIYDPVTRNIRYINGNGGIIPCGRPDPDVLYCNEATNMLYRWDEYGGPARNGAFVAIGGGGGADPVDLTGYLKSSDIVDDFNNLPNGYANLPLGAGLGYLLSIRDHVIVETISNTQKSLPVGRNEYWYILINGYEGADLVVRLTANGTSTKTETYPLDKGTAYYVIDQDAWYRYGNNNAMTPINPLDDEVTEDGEHAVTGAAVFTALEALQTQIDTLGNSEGLTDILNQITALKDEIDGLSDVTEITSAITELQTAVAALYTKPGTGIPKTDLAEAVQTSLGKADSAVQPSDLSGYALKSEMSFTDGTGDNADKVTIQLKSGTTKQVLKAHQDISEKADLLGGILDPAEWPRTSIVNVGEISHGTGIEVGDVLFNTSNSKLLLIVGPAAGQGNDIFGYSYMTLGNPGKNILYHCKRDGKFYLWSGTGFIQAAEIGGKADLENNGNVDMLKMDQWPRTVIKSVTPGLSNTEDEVYFDTGMHPTDPIGLFVLHDNVRYSIGTPSPHVVYLAKDTGRFYRWDNNNYEFVEVGTHAEFDVADLPTEGSTNPISSGAVYTALDGKATRIGGHLAYTDAPVVVLDAVNVPMPAILRPTELYGGKAKHYDDGNIRRLMGDNQIVISAQAPSPYLVYWDKSTERFYRWDATEGDHGTMTPLPVAGSGSGYNAEVVEVTTIGKGTFEQAMTRAEAQPSVSFQWILQGTDFEKVIWHTGNGIFIDANGTIMVEE